MALFLKKKIIYTSLEKKDLIEILQKNIEPFKKDNSSFLFEGKIDANGNFNISPTFDYNARNQIRPEIKGIISGKPEKKLEIEITFDLPNTIKGLIGIVIIINLIACLILCFNNFFLKWYMVLFAIIFFCSFTYAIYDQKVKKSLSILEKLLK
ncbi:hypothetical protein ACFFLS_03650 [Flavobacterium procerum]|uniref:Uncharacterized protein n=1 Tax=Flavobacterium procerum TaxID=1455569 RepID=A0ABV6BNB0_9FLAO